MAEQFVLWPRYFNGRIPGLAVCLPGQPAGCMAAEGLTTGVGTGETPLLAGIRIVGWPPKEIEVGNDAALPGFCALLSR